MVNLAAPPRIFTVDPRAYEPLGHFSCGSRSQHDIDADELLERLCRGETIPMTVRVAMHPTDADIVVAVSASAPVEIVPADSDPLYSAVDQFPRDAVCIALVGVGAAYHGTYVQRLSLGDYMLRDALAQWRSSPEMELPPFWATVARDNIGAIKLCKRHGFALERMGDDHDIAFRHAQTVAVD
jgi:hypothetical protein